MAACTAWRAAVRACCSFVRSRTGARSSSGWPCASARLFACSRRSVVAGCLAGGQSQCVKKGPPEEKVRTNGWSWLRGSDSNRRPPGYEPDELPLLHPARHCSEPEGRGAGIGVGGWRRRGNSERRGSGTRQTFTPIVSAGRGGSAASPWSARRRTRWLVTRGEEGAASGWGGGAGAVTGERRTGR